MNTAQRSYQFEPIIIGRGLEEFAREDEWRPTIFEIEDVSHRPPDALQAFEPEVPVAPVATVSPKSSAPVRSAGQRCRLAISSTVFMIAVAASVVAAWTAAWVSAAIVLISQGIESARARGRKAYGTCAAAVRGAVRRGGLAISSTVFMGAVAASVVAAWTAAWVSAAIVLISRRIESGRARRRAVSKPLGLQWVGAVALRHRRSTVAAISVALLGVVLAPSWNPPAVSPVAAVSTSTSLQASIPTLDVADASKSDPLPAAAVAEQLPASRPVKPAIIRAVLQTAPAASPEAQKPVVLAVADDHTPSTTAEPTPVPVAIVSAVLEAPKPAAAEPAAHVPSAVGPAPDAVTADRLAIDAVLAAYRRSYNSLDAGAVSAVWRGADTRALTRAFSTLTRQHVSFDRCDVRVTAADRARVRCDGILSYVQKAGDTTPQQRRVSWSMDLDRRDDRWEIVGVKAR